MGKTTKNKKSRYSKQAKKPRRINTSDFVGTVKSFKDFDALTYQKSLREE